MRFKISKASDFCYEEYKEINTLEELIEFTKTCHKGQSIILEWHDESERRPWHDESKEYIPEITIYDDYVE